MFFRNLNWFRFPTSLRVALTSLDAALNEHRLHPAGAFDVATRGFVSPLGRDCESLSHAVNGGLWITLGGEDKLLPAIVINEAANKIIAEQEAKEGRRLGGRARKRIRDEVLQDLLPRAFVKPSRVDAHLDLELGVIAIDSPSRKSAENLLTELRHALGSFPVVPLNPEVAPRGVLTGWLAGETLPSDLVLGDECEMKDPVDRGAVVKCQRQELGAEEIAKHLEAGKQCTRLALILGDRLSFVLGDDLVVRKLKFLEGAVGSLEHSDRDSVRAELDARYALMVGELRGLFGVVESAFKLSRVE